jgi:hypothetical protein
VPEAPIISCDEHSARGTHAVGRAHRRRDGPQRHTVDIVSGSGQEADMGWHYTDAVDDVKRLKREGRIGEAETLLLRCVDATEAEARREGYAPAP